MFKMGQTPWYQANYALTGLSENLKTLGRRKKKANRPEYGQHNQEQQLVRSRVLDNDRKIREQ